MRRSQLEHAIRVACRLIEAESVIVVGSQSILGTHSDESLPQAASRSMEVDLIPIAESVEEVRRLGDIIEGAAGELSMFESTHGFSIDCLEERSITLPQGWRERLIPLRNENTQGATGLCLEQHDLCASKLCANREKDLRFVDSLITARMASPEVIRERLLLIESDTSVRAQSWLAAKGSSYSD